MNNDKRIRVPKTAKPVNDPTLLVGRTGVKSQRIRDIFQLLLTVEPGIVIKVAQCDNNKIATNLRRYLHAEYKLRAMVRGVNVYAVASADDLERIGALLT